MLIANSYLLIWDYKRLMPIIKYKQKFIDLNRNNIQAGKLWEYGGIALALVSLLRIVYNIFLFWFITCILIGVAVFIFDKVGSKTTMEDVKR